MILAALSAFMLTGCKTKPPVRPSTAPAQPVVQVIPQQGAVAPKVVTAPAEAEPIYFNPVIEEVDQAPYVSEDGSLVFPGKVLVIREPGHWNVEAAQKNRRYFVPADNQPPQLAPPSKSYYDYIQSKRDGRTTAKLDVTRVRVTGYSQKEDRPQAAGLLSPGETLSWDPYLGWLAIPEDRRAVVEEKLEAPQLPPPGSFHRPQEDRPEPAPAEGAPAGTVDARAAAQRKLDQMAKEASAVVEGTFPQANPQK